MRRGVLPSVILGTIFLFSSWTRPLFGANCVCEVSASVSQPNLQIQGTSTVTDQQRTDLGINVRKVPSWPGDPGTPYKFQAKLTALGALDLSWKCVNPASGTLYQVYRKLGDAEATYVGGAGGKKFVDSTLPAGTSQVTYQIQAIRATGAGAWATFSVNLGVSPSGTTTVASASEAAVKIAA